MTLRSYIWGMRIAVLFSIGALAVVVNYVDPEAAGIPGKALFFLILFFALSGIFNLLLLWLRRGMTNAENAFDNLNLSFRQGILFAVFFTGLLSLQGQRILVWWSALILLAGVFLIELFFITKK